MSKGAKISMLLISLTVLLMAALMSGVIKSSHWEINNIILQAQYKRVSSEQIRVIVAAYPERSFFKVDAEEIRHETMKIPWVQQVYVNKKWPNSLIVKVVEHKAVAVWNKNKLLNEKGEIFEVDSVDDLTALPQISGNDNQSQLIWDKYIRYSDIIKSLGLDISSTNVSKRGGWTLFLSNSISINVGSQLMDARLVRLSDTWSNLIKQKELMPEYIDLRYPNGYVVKWQESNKQEKVDIKTEYITQTEGMIRNNG